MNYIDIDPPVPGSIKVQSATWIKIRKVVNRNAVERLQQEVRLDLGESEAIAKLKTLPASQIPRKMNLKNEIFA